MSDTEINDVPEALAGTGPKKMAKSETREFVEFLVKLAVFVLILRSFIIAPFSIPSESMQPKLLVGDYLFVSKWNYGYSRNSFPYRIPLIPGRIFGRTPERGDVVVFKAPPTHKVDFIKRVIGLPGDKIQMKAGQLFLNSKPIPKKRIADTVIPVSPNTQCFAVQFMETGSNGEARCRYPRFVETLPNGKSYEVQDMLPIAKDDTAEFTVPAGHLFMMGDNRDNSQDSRYNTDYEDGIGFVPLENLVGRAVMIGFSTDGSASWLNPISWFTAARWSRPGTGF